MATGEAAGHRDIQPSFFFFFFFFHCHSSSSPQQQQQQRLLLRARMERPPPEKWIFPVRQWIGRPVERGIVGKAGRRGSDVVWPLASFRCSAPRTDGITKDYRAMLGSSVCVCVWLCGGGFFFSPPWECLCVCVCVCDCARAIVYIAGCTCECVCVCVCVCVSPLDSWRAKACWAVCHTSLTQESSNGV